MTQLCAGLARLAKSCCLGHQTGPLTPLPPPHCALQGKVSGRWFTVHMLVQLLALTCAIVGFVIAILAFGWKSVPSQTLFAPHKWAGIANIGKDRWSHI